MIRASIALLAAALTAVQVYLIASGKEAICLNDGCAVVDSLTRVPPLWFNLAGMGFFLILFWLFFKGRQRREHLLKFARLLLLAALAAEAVLVFFQYAVARVFCSYCLIIFSAIVLLNLCCGLRQMIRGVAVFTAVMAACLSLQFTSSPGERKETLAAGSMAELPGEGDTATLYLFFSASCGHCEKVIASLGAGTRCTLRFNPIETIDSFAVKGIRRFPDYQPEGNRLFLQSLSIREVPLLLVDEGEELRFIKGERRIIEYLQQTCGPAPSTPSGISSVSRDQSLAAPPIFGLPAAPQQDACSVQSDCPPEGEASPQGR